MSMAEKYPLTEKHFELRKPTVKRWQYTLSGWLTLIRTDATAEGQEMEKQIHNRMWEDSEFENKIRKEYNDWLIAELEESWEKYEDDLRLNERKSVRIGGKYKGRGHGEKRREP